MKHLIKLATPEFEDDNYFCFGAEPPVILNERHDSRQLWFDFGRAIIYRQEKPERARKTSDTVPAITPKRIERKLLPAQEYIQPYVPVKGVHQYILPIDKWRVPSRSLAKRIKNADYPAFDRDEDGNVYACVYRGGQSALHTNEKLRDWITRNCAGRVVLDGIAVFERHDDAIMALVSGDFSRCGS